MGTSDLGSLEASRLLIQSQLDSTKTPAERNRLGQFATPGALATDILAYARTLLPENSDVRFLDPALGTGAFFSALLRMFAQEQIASAQAYEIDAQYGQPAIQLWESIGLRVHIGDFTRAPAPSKDEERANLIICNPPYVRHHHLSVDEKTRLQIQAKRMTGVTISKLAGLYCYFLLLCHGWLARDGIAGWLIPSEFMDVNYGRGMKQYLLHRVTLLRVHRFDPNDIQFSDALVSSAVLWFKNAEPPAGHEVEFTYGGSLAVPRIAKRISVSALEGISKWTSFPASDIYEGAATKEVRLSDFFMIKRGLATGDNSFFILDPEEIERHDIPRRFLIPILPSPRYLRSDVIEADDAGEPTSDRKRFLLSCHLPPSQVRESYPALWRYLQIGVEAGVHETYLCRHRTPWYSQEVRPPAPFLCTYMGRQSSGQYGRPFRFILNYSKATAANTYHLLYPKPPLAAILAQDPARMKALWQALNDITPEAMISGGRVYGGGLHKVEPRELANIPASNLAALLLLLDMDGHLTARRTAVTAIQLQLL